LSRHLVARFVQHFLVATCIATLSIIVVELLLDLDAVLGFGDGWRGAVGYLGIRLASDYASYVVPVTAFLAAFLTAAQLAASNEWVALRAGGVSLAAVSAPLLACGLALSVGLALFHEGVSIEARRAWNRERDDAPTLRFQSGAFWVHRGSWIFRVADADEASRRLSDIQMFERDERGLLVRSIDAKEVLLGDGDRWQLRDALVREFSRTDPSALPSVRREAEISLVVADSPQRALLRADARALSLLRLREFIQAREARGGQASRLRAALYGRATDWIATALLVALAIPIGLESERLRSIGRAASIATAAIAVYFALRSLGSVLSAQELVPPALASAGLVGVLALASSTGFARAAR